MADGKQRIDELAALVKEFGLSEASWESEGLRIAFRKNRARALQPRLEGDEFHIADIPVEHEAEPETVPPKPQAPMGSAVTSPMNGIFYNSPSPNASPFVKEGDTVVAGQVVGLIEAMKVFNEITSNFSGTVQGVMAETGQIVQPGDVLMYIG